MAAFLERTGGRRPGAAARAAAAAGEPRALGAGRGGRALYRAGVRPGRGQPTPDADRRQAAAAILRALPGDARPGRPRRRAGPLSRSSRSWAQRQAGGMGAQRAGWCAVPAAARREPLQWSAPANLEQVQRGTLALLRREVVTCPPPQFADFLLRWQGVHPDDAPRRQPKAWPRRWTACRGCRCRRSCGSRRVLPARVPGYQPRWLDEWIAGGEWRLGLPGRRRRRSRAAGLLQPRDAARSCRRRRWPTRRPWTRRPSGCWTCLRSRGASFVTDLAAGHAACHRASSAPPLGRCCGAAW